MPSNNMKRVWLYFIGLLRFFFLRELSFCYLWYVKISFIGCWNKISSALGANKIERTPFLPTYQSLYQIDFRNNSKTSISPSSSIPSPSFPLSSPSTSSLSSFSSSSSVKDLFSRDFLEYGMLTVSPSLCRRLLIFSFTSLFYLFYLFFCKDWILKHQSKNGLFEKLLITSISLSPSPSSSFSSFSSPFLSSSSYSSARPYDLFKRTPFRYRYGQF